jgi:hypothetical protein
MEAAHWAAVAAIASALSATVSLCLSIYTGRAAKAQIKAADFNNCMEVVKQLGEALRRCRDAANDDVKRFEIRELLNLMEALALLINSDKIAPSTEKYTRHFLIEAWASLEANPEMAELMHASVTSETTYRELLQFSLRYSTEIRRLVSARRVHTESIDDAPT